MRLPAVCHLAVPPGMLLVELNTARRSEWRARSRDWLAAELPAWPPTYNARLGSHRMGGAPSGSVALHMGPVRALAGWVAVGTGNGLSGRLSGPPFWPPSQFGRRSPAHAT